MSLLLSIAALLPTNMGTVHHPSFKDTAIKGSGKEEEGHRGKDQYKGGGSKEKTQDGGDNEKTQDKEGEDSEKTQDKEGGDKEKTQDKEGGDKEKTQDKEGGDKEKTQDKEGGDKEKTQDKEGGDNEKTQDKEGGDKEKTQDKEGGDKEKTQDKEGGDSEKTQDKEGGDKEKTQDKEEGEKERNEDKMKDLEVCVAPGGGGTQDKLLSGTQEEGGEHETGGGVEKVTGTGSQRVYTLDEVSYHCDPASCWIVLWDHVYDVTSFIREHPGGEDIIYENAGRDATSTFCDVGHSNDALLMIMPYEIGVLAEHEKIFKRHKTKSFSY